MKLELTTATKTAIWKIGNAALMCQDNVITSEEYERISLEAMNEANGAQASEATAILPRVSNNEVVVCEHKEYRWNKELADNEEECVNCGHIKQTDC